MNRYILIRRLTGPSVLLLLGVVALLHEANLVHWVLFWPLLLILLGLLKLAQRAALAAAGDEAYYPTGYPGYPYAGAPAQPQGTQPPAQTPGTAIVPAAPEVGTTHEGGQQ
ncbi:MAG TPA: hypothetical protein VF392_08335 [Terracidiphilus sp.]